MTFNSDMLRMKRKGWTEEANSSIPCLVAPDGLLIAYSLEDIENTLNSHYHRRGNKWYFSPSRGDREIAENDFGIVFANPQVLWRHTLNKGE